MFLRDFKSTIISSLIGLLNDFKKYSQILLLLVTMKDQRSLMGLRFISEELVLYLLKMNKEEFSCTITPKVTSRKRRRISILIIKLALRN